MADPTFGQRLAASIRAEIGVLDDDQEQIVANLIDTEFAHSQGKLSGFALEPSSPVKLGSRKQQDALFDALCGACGLQREGMTKPMRGGVGKALAAIMAVMPNLTTTEIVIRAREYRRKHPTWHLSPSSLAKYWGTCATQESAKGLLDEPAGWRSRHHLIFPEAENGSTGEMFSRKPWETIGRVFQEKIVRWMARTAPSAPRPLYSE